MAKNTVEVIIKARDQATKVLTTFQSKFKAGMTSLRKSIFSLKGAVVALAGAAGVGLLAKSLIGVASEVENFTLRLKFLMGSQEAAAKQMQFFQEVASKVPFGLREIINAGVTLEAMGADSEKWIRPLIDMAAVMGVQLPVAAENLGRSLAAGMAASEIFREKGIRKMTEEFHGLNDITKLAVKEQGKLFYSFVTESKKIAGAADEMKDTWSGIVSMVGDSVYKIKQSIMDAGIYEAVKKVGLDIKEKLDEWTGDTERFTHDISLLSLNLARTINLTASIITKSMLAIKVAMTFPDAVRRSIDKLAEWDAKMRGYLTVPIGDKLKQERQLLFFQAEGYGEMADEAEKSGSDILEMLNKLDSGMADSLADLEELIREGTENFKKNMEEGKDALEDVGDEAVETERKLRKLGDTLNAINFGMAEESARIYFGTLEGGHRISAEAAADLRNIGQAAGDMNKKGTKDIDDFTGHAEREFMAMAFTAGVSFDKIIREFSIMVMKLMAKAATLAVLKWIFPGAKEGGTFWSGLPFVGRYLRQGQGGAVLPAMQEGGAIVRKPTVVSPGVIAGEAGPEIIPLSKMKMMGETNIYLTLQHPLVDDRKYWNDLIKNKINPAIRRVAHDISTSRTLEI